MILRVWIAGRKPNAKAAESRGLPVRITTYEKATQTSKVETLLIMQRGSIRSIVCRPGECDLYLSPRAQFKLLDPEASPATSTPPGGGQ